MFSACYFVCEQFAPGPWLIFAARKLFDVHDWVAAAGTETTNIEPGSRWENGYCDSFNARFRDEFLNGEIFYSLREAQNLIEEWRKHYNTKRPRSALGYRPPAPETIFQMDPRPIMHKQSNWPP